MRAIIRRPWVLIGAAGMVVFALWVMSTRREPHHLRVAFPTAVSLVDGLDVQIDGLDAGKISRVDYRDGHAVVEIGIDDSYWPLTQGTSAVMRYGTTVGNGTRRIDVEPGPADAPRLPEDGIIDGRHATSLVELDEVFNTLDRSTRSNLRSMLSHTAGSFDGHTGTLNAGIAASAGGMRAVQALTGDLAEDTYALRGLLVNAHRTTRALAAKSGQISDLVAVSAATFDEFAGHSADIRDALAELPGSLVEVRSTLRRLDTSVDGLDPLIADLGPGAAALRPLAPVLRDALARLRADAPIATQTLRTLRATTPSTGRLLSDATPVMQTLTSDLRDFAPMLACVRPYAPEAAGALANWASYNKNYDGISHYARVKVTASPYSLNSTPDLSTAQYLDLFPQIQYAMPRPPGLNAGKPWLRPECGAGADALDPAKDPEETAPASAPIAPAGPTRGDVIDRLRRLMK